MVLAHNTPKCLAAVALLSQTVWQDQAQWKVYPQGLFQLFGPFHIVYQWLPHKANYIMMFSDTTLDFIHNSPWNIFLMIAVWFKTERKCGRWCLFTEQWRNGSQLSSATNLSLRPALINITGSMLMTQSAEKPHDEIHSIKAESADVFI